MINRSLRRKYFEMQGKVIFPENKGCNNKQLAATVSANFASIGFPMTTEQLNNLICSTEEDINEFYSENYTMLKEILGADKIQKPFYPDFPEGCMDKTDADYFIDQIIYGLSGLTLEPIVYLKEKKRFPFIGTPMRRIMLSGSIEDLHNTFILALKSPIAYSKLQRDFMYDYLSEYPEKIEEVIINSNTKNRENAVTCAIIVENFLGNTLHTKSFMKQPTDLLRYAAYKDSVKNAPDSDPFVSIRLSNNSMQKYAIGRKERQLVMDTLADMSKNGGEALSNKMHSNENDWKKLFSKIHITDKAWNAPKYKEVKKAIIIIQSNKKLDRPARQIEEAVKNGDLETAITETKKFPGEFMRRFDKLYRMSIEQGKESLVIDTLKEVSSKAGIATVTGTIGSIEKRNLDESERIFKTKNNKMFVTKEKNRKALTQSQITAVVDSAMSGLSEKYKNKEPIGKVYISDSIKSVKIPTNIRDNSGSIGALTSGSKMPVPEDWKYMRFFIGWTNLKAQCNRFNSRVDIDLSVAFCDESMKLIDFCGWNGSKSKPGFIYSGDVQDGGSYKSLGRAEFVDVDLDALRKNKVKYIIPSVNSFIGQPFSEQPNTTFGVMRREKNDMGKAYEPASVVNRFVLDSNSTMIVPYLIDIENMEIIWLNESLDSNVAIHSFYDISKRVSMQANSSKMSLEKLILANVMATGTIVDNPKDADVIFVLDTNELESVKREAGIKGDDKFILSQNMEYILGYLMSE